MAMNPRLLRPRASGFNPRSIAGLKFWIDASKYSSLTFNGSDISQAADLSGNGYHAAQTTANNQPTYESTGFNGKPTFYINTTDSLISSATIANYMLTPTTNPTFYMVLACKMPLINDSGNIILGSDAQASGRFYLSLFFGGVSLIYDTVNASGGRLTTSLTESDYTSPVVLTVFRSGATMGIRRNGVSVASKTNASGNYTSTTAKLQLGKCDGGGANVMYLSECLVYASALSGSELSAVERSVGRKWGVTVA